MEITIEQLCIIELAIDSLISQRSTLDQETGTDNALINVAQIIVRDLIKQYPNTQVATPS